MFLELDTRIRSITPESSILRIQLDSFCVQVCSFVEVMACNANVSGGWP